MKKILSIILATAMVLTSLVFSTTALAEQNSVTVKYSVFDGGVFTMMPTDIEVTADLSDKYAELIGYNDTLEVPTVLDATIKAHIEMFGEDFMDYAPLMLSSAGWVNGAFGEETNAVGYRNNGASCMSFDEALTDGGYVEFMFYGDTSYWSDTYNFFENRSETVFVGEPITLTMSADTWGYVAPASYVIVSLDGDPIDYTDEDGNVTFKFDKAGKHIITALPNYEEDEYFFAPYCEITVCADYTEKQIENAGKYLVSKTDEFGVDNAGDFVTYLKSGEISDNQKKHFVKDVKANLEKNEGKIIGSYGENLGTYGAVIVALNYMGYCSKDFYGNNIVEAMEAMDAKSSVNPYLYRFAVEAADDEYAKMLCDAFIEQYYTMGSGMNYWGYACDNTAMFIATVSQYASDYADYIKDAISVMDEYAVKNGFCYNPAYGTDASADSTALAMMAYACAGDSEKAFNAYKALTENFEMNDGSFTSNGGDDNYSTKDALIGLEYYHSFVIENGIKHINHIERLTKDVAPTCTKAGSKTYKCVLCEEQRKVSVKALGHKVVNNTYVAPTYAKEGKTAGQHCSRCGKILVAQKTIAKLTVAKPTNVTITAKSKAFKLAWSKNSKATGYQIQYSTKSDFSSKKTVTITNKSTVSKTISSLKAKQKYYVRIRAYKTENGKKYYSSWVNKTVTTKK